MDLNNIKILIADDDKNIVEMLKHILTDAGFIVVGIAENGEKAIELSQKCEPDIILMDINMPVMDGIEASEIIFKTCFIPVIILTGCDGDDLVERSAKAGVFGYLTKPIDIKEIKNTITIVLSRFNDLKKDHEDKNEIIDMLFKYKYEE